MFKNLRILTNSAAFSRPNRFHKGKNSAANTWGKMFDSLELGFFF